MNFSKFAAAAILSLMLATAITAGAGILAQPVEALKAEYIVQIMESARAEAEQTLAELQSKNVSVPVGLSATYGEAMNWYRLALQYRSQANYSACSEVALRAQNMFREVAGYASALSFEPEQPGDQALRAKIELRARIARMQSVIEELVNATSRLGDFGVNASSLAGDLAQLRLRLEDAVREMDGGAVSVANQTLAEVDSRLQAVSLLIKDSAEESDAIRARDFIRNAEQMMTGYEARIRAQTGIPELQRQEALAIMQQAMIQLQAANSSLDSGNLTEAVRLMEQIRARLQEACGAMGEGNQTRLQVEMRIMQMQMEVEGLAARLQELKGYGLNVSVQEQELSQIREQLRAAECMNASMECNLAQIQARISGLGEALDEIEGQRASQERARIQGEIDALFQRIGNCSERARQYKQGGSNVSHVEAMIQQATSIAQEAQLRLDNGDLKGAGDLALQANAIISQAEFALNQMGGGREGGSARH